MLTRDTKARQFYFYCTLSIFIFVSFHFIKTVRQQLTNRNCE